MGDFSAADSFDLTVGDTTARAVALIDDDVREVTRASKAKDTLLAYRSNWTAFQAWCADRGVTRLPAEPETVSSYLVARMKEGLKASSLAVAVVTIRHSHKAAGLFTRSEHEAVLMVMKASVVRSAPRLSRSSPAPPSGCPRCWRTAAGACRASATAR